MKRKAIAMGMCLLALAAAPAAAKNEQGKRLPPGLAKKSALPPGWQKKLAQGEILDEQVYWQGVIYEPEDSLGVITIKVEGKIIRLINATREILEIM